MRAWRWIAVSSALALAIAASVAMGATSQGGKRSSGRADAVRVVGPGAHLAALADKLGVSSDRLRRALEAAHEKAGLPKPPAAGNRPTRAAFEKHCTDLTDALAAALQKSGDDVRAAIKAVAKDEIEKAVDAKRLSRERADRILARIDSSSCLPPLGPGLGIVTCAERPAGRPSGFIAPGPPGDAELPPPRAPGFGFPPA